MAVSITVVESTDRQLTMLARGAGLIVAGSVPIGELAGIDRQGKPPDVLLVDLRRAVDELRSAGRLRGAIIGVGGMAGEVFPALVAASDVVLADPAEAAALLAALSR